MADLQWDEPPPIDRQTRTSAPAAKPIGGLEWDEPPPIDQPTAARPTKKSSVVDSAIRGTGQAISSTATYLGRTGLPTDGMEAYGDKLAADHPASINSLGDVLHDPGQTAKEALGEVAPQLGLSMATAKVGASIGGRIGANFDGIGAIPGAAIGGVIGAFAPNYIQETGGIVRTRRDAGLADSPVADLGGAAAAAVDLLGPENMVARKVATGTLKKVGTKSVFDLAKKFAIGAAVEGGTEAVQSGIERAASGQSLTDQGAIDDYAVSGAKGAAGGGPIEVLGHVGAARKENNFNPDAGTGNVDPSSVTRPKPSALTPEQQQARIDATPEGGDQHDAFSLDDVLDHGIDKVETSAGEAVTSEAGAKGAFQLLPSTAKSMAQRLGLKFDEQRLLKDKKYNRTLAREYLQTLSERYDGDMFLAVTAYHAGEGNVDSWVKRFGYDPNDKAGFTAKIEAAGNPRSAAYAGKVLTSMGRPEFGAAPASDYSPPATVDDFDLSQGAIMAQLRRATMDEGGVAAAPDKSMLSLSNKLSQALNDADVEAAAKHVAAEHARIAKDIETLAADQTQLDEGKAEHTPEEQARYQAGLDARLAKLIQKDQVLDGARGLIDRVTSTLNQSQPDLFASHPVPAEAVALPQESRPTPEATPPTLITYPGPSQTFGRRASLPAEPHPTGLVAADTHLANDLRGLDANTQARVGILDTVLGDTTTRSPVSRFVANLKRRGLEPTLTAEETQRIADHEARMEPFVPDESGNFGIPERQPPAAASAPVAPAPVQEAPAEQAAPAAAAQVEANVRTRAETHADTLGSSRRAWFLKGVDRELGDTETPAPASKSKAAWFDEGRTYVRTEAEHQDRERGGAKPAAGRPAGRVAAEPKPAAPTKTTRSDELKAKETARKERVAAKSAVVVKAAPATDEKPSRGGKTKFTDAVVLAEQQRKITPQVGMQLRAMAEAEWHADNWSALDTAISEKSGAPGAKKFSKQARAEVTGAAEKATPPDWKATMGAHKFYELKQAWQRVLQDRLDELGLHDANLFITTHLGTYVTYGEHDIAGSYSQTVGLGHVIDVAFDIGNAAETLDHEAIHALRNMNVFTPAEWKALETWAQADPALKDYADQDIYAKLSDEKKVEEMVAEGFARWKASRVALGDDLALNPPNLWEKALVKLDAFLGAVHDFISALGFKTGTSVMRAIDSGEIGRRARGLTRQDLERGSSRQAPAARKVKEETPATPVTKAGRALKVSLADAAKKGHVWAVFTEDLANMAKKFLPSAGKLIELHSRNFALSREFEERLLEIKQQYEKLPTMWKATKPGSISTFLYDSRMAGEWGFKPDYMPNAKVGAEMKQRFDAMPKAAQDMVKAVFRFNFDSRNQLYKATVSAIDAEYDPLIAAAGADAERKTKISDDKKRALAQFSRVFDTKDGTPYTPLKREGQWVVVGRSDAYMEAKRADDAKAMDELRSKPDHYFVDFRDTAAEADALRTNVATKFGKQNTSYFERSDVPEAEIGGGELHMAFQQLKTAVEAEVKSKPGSKAAKELHRLATDLYLHVLSDTSARKGEMGADLVPAKDPVTGEVLDMMRAFVTRGQATTHYIASISNNAEIQQSIRAMREELSQTEGDDRTDAARFFNELMWRYAKNLGHQPNRTVDKIARSVSVFNLLLSPFYYLQNATQAVLLSQPLVAAHVGYAQAAAAFSQAYVDFAAMTKTIGITDRVDFSKAPADVRELLHKLAERGRLDAGFAMELGSWEMNGDGALPTTWNKVDRFLRMAPQRVEVMNRVVTGIAAYRAALKKGGTKEDAFQFASKVVYDSHGDYSGFNAPKPFTALGNVGKIVLQFRKFQFIMASLVAKEFHHTFKGATKGERVAGLRALGFVTAHMAAVGGIVGMPAASLIGPVVMMVLNALDEDDDQDYGDWQEELRKFLGAGEGSWMANLLFKGAPYSLLGADTSGKLGMGNMLSLAPYADLSHAADSRDDLAKTEGTILSGPFGGVLAKGTDAWDYLKADDMRRAIEAIAPGMVGGSLKAMRQADQGVTARNGDTLMTKDELSALDAFYTALGVTPSKLADQADRRSLTFEAGKHWDDKTTLIKRKYAAAAKASDVAKLGELKTEWAAMQDARQRDGFKRQPLATLLKAPTEQRKREHGVVGGVETTRTNRGFVQAMAGDANDLIANPDQ